MSSEKSAGVPPQVEIMQMAFGFVAARATVVAAELAIADRLAEGPKSSADLASETGTQAESLHRLLRALASRGIFAIDDQGRWSNTPLSTPLRTDVPNSVRDFILYFLNEGPTRAWDRLGDVVRSGHPSFAAVNGSEFFDYLQAHPDLAARFDGAMTSQSQVLVHAIAGAYDFSRFASVIDVAGGRGHVLEAIMAATPGIKGVLFDLPHVVPRAKEYLAGRGLASRCEFVEGSFFESVPAGHDAYVLKHILHDWDDAHALQILRKVRAAIPATGTLLVLDAVIAEGNEPQHAKWIDLQMMVVLGGKERTHSEHRALLGEAGFGIERVIPIPGTVAVIEARPV